MNKTEFLEILQQKLTGEMPSGEIYANLRYYREYIDSEIAKGKTEDEVLSALGDPRLIARTLIDADEAVPYDETYEEPSSNGQNRYERAYETEDLYEESSSSFHWLDLSTWYGKLIVILSAALIIFLIVTIVGALIPVLLIAAAVIAVISLFRRR